MVWLNATNSFGNNLYLIVHPQPSHPEQDGACHTISATLGDGCYEGEVVIELNGQIDVTFADHYFRPNTLRDFRACIDLDQLKEALAGVLPRLGSACSTEISAPVPHVGRSQCSEAKSSWRAMGPAGSTWVENAGF